MSVLTLNVDEVKRTLSAESSNPFVVHDKEVDIVRFAINSGFADIVLDGQVALRVMYQRPGETEVRAQTLTYYDTDGLHNYYDWQLSQSDLAKNGSLMVALCILDISGGEVSEWHTTPCAVLVLSTIHTDDSDEGDDTITPTVKERVAVLESMIQRVASGAPIVVSSASAMTDTDQIYVLSTNGKWYYHNGSSWVAGGEYGGVADGSVTTNKLADGAVTTAKIADGAITAGKIASGVGPAVDATLAQTGAAADAKVTGDRITAVETGLDGTEDDIADLKSALNGFEENISEKNVSKNLLNEAELVTGYLNTANGNVNSETAYKTSGFIEVSQYIGKKLTFSNYNANSRIRTKVTPNGYIFCNSKKTRIAGGTWKNDIDIPNNAIYARICTGASTVAATAYPMLEVTEDGTMTDYEAYYEPYYTIRDSAIDIDDTLTKRGKPADAKATGDAISQYSNVIIPDRPKNLLNWNDPDVVAGAWLDPGVVERADHSITGFIDVHNDAGKNIIISTLDLSPNKRKFYILPSYAFYNSEKERVSGGNWKSVIVIPDNAYYFRASLQTTASTIKEFYSIGVSTADKPQTLSDYYEEKNVVSESMIKHTLTCHLPQKLYILRNVAYELYFDQIFEEDVSRYKITQNGRSAAAISVFNNRIRFKVTAATTQTAIQILVYDKELLLDSFELQLVIADIPESEINLLPLGDSLTNHCVWESELMNIVPSLICVGSRNRNVADSDEETRTVYNDGRAGFTAAMYLNGKAYTGGSDGGGNESPNNYWYDPVNEQFSMSYYMTNHFPTNQNTPNALTYFLGMNDLSGSGKISDIIERMQTMIDDIRSYNSDLPLVIVSPQLQSLGDITFSTKKRFWKFAEALEELAGTYENVAYVALYPFMDSSNNYPTTEIGINTRNTRTELQVTDITHPAKFGYWQIADLVAGAVAYLFSE